MLSNQIAQYRAWKRGVVHTTLNPEGPGAVRIHLVPPRWRLFGSRPHVVILNGSYILPLGYSWAVLLGNFIEEVNRYDGEPMDGADMDQVVENAVEQTRRAYPGVSRKLLADDLGEILTVLFDVAGGKEPSSPIGAMSLREYAPNMAAPHRMDLLVSAMATPEGGWNCNLKCRHCYAAGQPAAETGELATEDWKRVIDRCREAGIPQLTFTGGEPTLRPDLAELIAYSQWFVTRLNTNGLLLTPELCGRLREASLDSVQVTLYSAGKDCHNRLVGASGWDKTVAGIRNALEAGLDLSVNTPLCRENSDYTATLAFLRGLGVRYVSCSGLIETGNAADGSGALQREEMDALLKEAAAYCAETGMELRFTSPGRASMETLRELGLTVPMCGACLSNMAVAPDGMAAPCQSWLGAGHGLGNLLETDWRSIWNHPLCRKIRGMDEARSLDCPLRGGLFDGEGMG